MIQTGKGLWCIEIFFPIRQEAYCLQLDTLQYTRRTGAGWEGIWKDRIIRSESTKDLMKEFVKYRNYPK